jgi:hypothetical protein
MWSFRNSSDYQLTNRYTGAPISDSAGCKQLQADFTGFTLRLAFTGIADVVNYAGLRRWRTIDWLSSQLKALPKDSQFQDVCEVLAKRTGEITRVDGSLGVLELVLTVAAIGNPFRVAVISNVDWSKRAPQAKEQFTEIYTITKPFCRISGYPRGTPKTGQSGTPQNRPVVDRHPGH